MRANTHVIYVRRMSLSMPRCATSHFIEVWNNFFETMFWQGSIMYISIPRRSNCTIFFWTMQIRMQFRCKGVSLSMSRCMTYHLLKFSTTSWNHVLARTLYISLPQRSIFTKSPDACKYTCIFWQKECPWACPDAWHVFLLKFSTTLWYHILTGNSLPPG